MNKLSRYQFFNILAFCCIHMPITHGMEKTIHYHDHSCQPSENISLWKNFATILGSLIVEIINFDPHEHKLTVIHPNKTIKIKKNGHRLTINGKPYDPSIEGTLYLYDDGILRKANGKEIFPLL